MGGPTLARQGPVQGGGEGGTRERGLRQDRGEPPLFEEAGADPSQRVVTYCGGGIAASNDAFILAMLGYENVAVYDASMSEYASDPSLPLVAD